MAELHRQLILHGFEQVLSGAETPAEQRRVRWAHEILSLEQDTVNYLHSGFCQAALPHREPKNPIEPWIRRNGAYQLVIRPGILPLRDKVVPVGVPYGTKARLIMIYFQTEAVRTRSQVVDLGPNMASWLKRMGLTTSGGARGSYAPVREQALRIARCEFTMRFERSADEARLADQRIIDGMDLWHVDGTGEPPSRGRREWVRHVRLSDAFFTHLMEHSVPLSEEAIARLKHSSLALDLYVWLTYRLHTLRRETTVPWYALSDHFGSESGHRQLAFRLKEVLRDVTTVYPEANVEASGRGIILRPSRSSVATACSLVRLPSTVGRA
jgi:Plasmid encoded RepA protein